MVGETCHSRGKSHCILERALLPINIWRGPAVHGKEVDYWCCSDENGVYGITSAVCLRRGITDRCGVTVGIAYAEGLL